MKRIIPFFAVCLGLSVLQTTLLCAATNTKRDSGVVISTNNSNTRSTASKKTDNTRTGTARTANNKSARPTATNTPAPATTSSRTVAKSRTTKNTTGNKQTRAIITSGTLPTIYPPATRISATKTPVSRNAITRKNISRASTKTTTELDSAKISDIKSKDYSKCKTVYYDCMDEFCANKDTDLRRCACSSRIHEFDKIKQQLDDAEDKMLDFNQRLLLVGLDKEDAAAVNVASEGEIGFSTTDTSTSERLLKKISKNLNTSGDSKINNDLSSVSLSLDLDAAWDSVSAVSGISTTAKSGVDLYNAAQPVCIEMAREVCSDDELDIAKNSYQLFIQQDCNTVAKSYDSKYNQAMDKIHESGALLDMARLNAYQERNSDDILTCKQKILDKLYDSSVCGSDLHKCLDITGQYINPADGSAFLSEDLYNITTLLTAPTGSSETWSKMSQNSQFVSFINSKKKFLKSATEQCQDIADTVWKDFLDDALAQIKLAQNAKLEEIRQSCTTLVSECKTSALTSLENFDARALSTFEVIADTTVNTLCSSVETSCHNLLNASGGGGTEWSTGITEIAADISYESILETCMTVGKDCVIQQCNGTAGNFALCGDYSSTPRRAILKHSACWNEVLACVQQSNNLANITPETSAGIDYYKSMYGDSVHYVDYGCGSDTSCLLTEQIWGNCEYDPAETIITTNNELFNLNNFKKQNKILTPTDPDKYTLLSWFAFNTGTTDAMDSCSAYYCPTNYQYDPILKVCKRITSGNITTDDGYPYVTTDQLIHVTTTLNNYCPGGKASKDIYGNCCTSTQVASNGICVPNNRSEGDPYNAIFIQEVYCVKDISVTSDPGYFCERTVREEHDANTGVAYTEYTISEDKIMYLYCVTTDTYVEVDSSGFLACNGYLIVVDQNGVYKPAINPTSLTSGSNPLLSLMSFNETDSIPCKYTYAQDSDTSTYSWKWKKLTDDPNDGVFCNTINSDTGNNNTPTVHVITPESQFSITY